MDPKTFSPSKWGIFDVYEEFDANLAATITICED
jgi:hypothetical protein